MKNALPERLPEGRDCWGIDTLPALHDDTHAQTARKGDLVLGDDGESRSSHGTAGIIRGVSVRRKVEAKSGSGQVSEIHYAADELKSTVGAG
jgi:hypothetical protein